MIHLKRDEKGRMIRLYGDDQKRICPVCNESYIVPAWRAIDPKRGKFCSKKCSYIGRELKCTFQKGHPDLVPKEKRGHSEETKKKMLQINRDRAKLKYPHLWNENEHLKRKNEMVRVEYKKWRKFIFERDKYSCKNCGDTKSFLHVDHIEPWVKNKELRYELNNGITLCYRCHFKKTYPNASFDEERAFKWGVPTKYRNYYK